MSSSRGEAASNVFSAAGAVDTVVSIGNASLVSVTDEDVDRR